MKKVSVHMITYNHERYIKNALDSILMQQTDFDYEIVIGDDLSKDRTREILLDYKDKYPDKIRLILSDKNVGAVNNFIRTYEACEGEYIAILEGDDYWTLPNKLQKQVEFLDRHTDYSMCFAKASILNEGMDYYKSNETIPLEHEIKEYYSTEDLLKDNVVTHLTVLARASTLTEFPDWLRKLSLADWPSHIMRSKYGNIGFINETMAVYRKHGGGVSSTTSNIKWIRDKIDMYVHLDEYLEKKYTKLIAQLVSKLYCELAITYKKQGDHKTAVKTFNSSFEGNWLCGSSLKTHVKAFAVIFFGI